MASVIKVEELLSSAKKLDAVRTQLSVCRSDAGYYLGKSEEGKPTARYSSEYWKEEAAAETALRTGFSANEKGPTPANQKGPTHARLRAQTRALRAARRYALRGAARYL